MKKEHKELTGSILPELMSKLNEVLAEGGLSEFKIAGIRLAHHTEHACNPPCTDDEICVQVQRPDGSFGFACREPI